jgi:hypothetical protein
MPKPTKFTILFLLALTVYSCQSVSNEIDKSFDKVNRSLVRSNEVILRSDSLTLYRTAIDGKAHDGNTALNADNLYETTVNAVKLFRRAKDLLQAADSAGEDTKVAEKLLFHTALGDSIRAAAREVASKCHKNLVTPNKRPALDKLLANNTAIVEENWDGVFINTPTVAALMILSAFELKCREAATFTLADINAQYPARP